MFRYLERFFVISIILLLSVVFFREFVNLGILEHLETVVLIMVLIPGVILARGIPFYMSLIALILGHFLILKYNMTYTIWLEGITKNLPLAIVFLMVPVLSIPLKEGGYLQAVNFFVSKYVTKTCSLFFALSSSVFGLASIANLGAVRVFHDLVEDVNLPPRFLAKVYSTGFASCMTWSPYFASVNLVLYYTGVSFSSYFLPGFLYGLSLLVLGNLLFYKDRQCQNEVRDSAQQIAEPPDSKKKLYFLVLNLIGLFLAVIIGEKLFAFSSMMLLVSILALVYAVFWSFGIKRFKEFLRQMKNYDQNILQVKNEMVFFLSVGFLGVVMANTPLKGFIEVFFQEISGYSVFVVIEVIIILTALLSVVGIHHVITITTLGLSLKAQVLGLSDLSYSLTLIASYTVSMILSPFAPFNIIAGGLLKENSFVVSLKWNRTFAIMAILFSGVFITLVNYLV
ncbi:MAG: hypothetical protein JM58_01455 [Peptococcaceae bacterium BICA1-8]|nr:MAG: hypothetical protein JM58_01455 [Peptococcaceae bacterium BICA1-8]